VSNDFRESFAREILNYGHTVGHAIEMHSDYKLRHGEAVAIGMVFAAELSNVHGTLNAKDVALHRELASKFDLPIQYPRAAWSEVYSNLTRDKKNRGGKIRFVTLKAPGLTDRLEVVSENLLREIYERIS
jgi:3-dehydroquinate synthase